MADNDTMALTEQGALYVFFLNKGLNSDDATDMADRIMRLPASKRVPVEDLLAYLSR